MEFKRRVLYSIVTVCVVISSYIWVSGIYYENGTSVIYTTSEVELLDGKYIISDEYLVTNSSETECDYWSGDVADGVICYIESGDYYKVGVYSIVGQEVLYETHSGFWIPFPRTDNGLVSFSNDTLAGGEDEYSYIYDCDEDTIFEIDYPSVGITSIWNGTVTFEDVKGLLSPDNYSIVNYNLDDDDFTIVAEDDGSEEYYWLFYQPDIHQEYVVYAGFNYDPGIINQIFWYDIDTEETNHTDYELAFGSNLYLSKPRVWDDTVVFISFLVVGGRGGGADFSIVGLDLSYEGAGISDFDVSNQHEEYDSLDISHDLVIYDAYDEVLGTWNCYAYDLIEDEEFNVSVVEGIESFSPSVWFGDDGHGFVTYTKYNGDSGNYDIYFRYINDTTVTSADDSLPLEPEMVSHGVYNLYWIYVLIISTILAIGLVLIDRIMMATIQNVR